VKTKRRNQEQKLRDAASYAASCLKDAGEALHNLGPSQHYADAHAKCGRALKDLVQWKAGSMAHVADWSWDGYEGLWTFRWEFGFQAAQPGATYAHDTRFVAMSCAAQLDGDKLLDEELTRLCHEARHYDEMRGAMMRWATTTAKAVTP
jgi:hypothetical protein